jgi:transposase
LSAPSAALTPESSAASGSALDLGITTRLAREEAGIVLCIGGDAHKRVHAAVALDALGREVGRRRVPNSAAGWREVLAWAAEVGGSDTPRRWGIEGAWGYGRGLAQHLVAAGETGSEVRPRWTAAARKRARTPGKSDPRDATAVARLVLQEGTALPAVAAEDETAVLDLLTAERDAALADATRLRNHLHHLLLQLDPEYEARLPALRSAAGLAALEGYTAPSPRPLDLARADAVRRLAPRRRLAVDQAEALAAQIRARAQAGFVALTRRCGVSLRTAGALAGILGPGHRFATDAQLAADAGVAPVEASSAGRVRHRLNRGGNRRLTAILHRIAVTQAGASAQAKAYLARRAADGKSRREALRARTRHLVRTLWRLWQECLPGPATAALPEAHAAA